MLNKYISKIVKKEIEESMEGLDIKKTIKDSVKSATNDLFNIKLFWGNSYEPELKTLLQGLIKDALKEKFQTLREDKEFITSLVKDINELQLNKK